MKPPNPSKMSVAALLSILIGLPVAAERVSEALRAELEIEERLLERARDQYRETRAAERDALRHLQQLAQNQDGVLNRVLQQALVGGELEIPEEGPGSAEPFQLLRLRSTERELTSARETALALAREGADLRRDLIARAARIRELRFEILEQGRIDLTDDTGLDGLWQLELAGAGITGVVSFRSEGTLVTGAYRLSNGSQGSIRGTLSNNRLELERIDWNAGFDTVLEGELDSVTGLIEGTWTAVDVSGGAPGSGDWVARRISAGGQPRSE